MQTNFKNIQKKLEAFIRRYYTNELLKGVILFFALGLLYFLFTLFIEYILWLNTTARTLLFWVFVIVELGLLAKFIVIPLAKLFKLHKGINYEDASKIIGHHFPEVSDKLLNVLQLHQNPMHTELLLASIEQKSMELSPIPFKLAVNFNKNIKYLKYAAIPFLILLLSFLLGKTNWFSSSLERVVHYKTAYEAPAPFQFYVINDHLNAIENRDFKLVIKIAGDVIPENALIEYNNETYFLRQKGIGEFEYLFSEPKENIEFRLTSNNVTSKPYTINVIEVPSLLSFEMVLDYPEYTKKKDEILKSTGNAVVPEGTSVTWILQTKSTDRVKLYAKDTLLLSTENRGIFRGSKRIYNTLNYGFSTSNKALKDYENMAFNIDVVKDEFPSIDIKMKQDSLDLQTLYFYGQIRDDYGFSKLQLVYYPSDNESNKKIETLAMPNSNISDFITAFPNNLDVQTGVSYDLYFQVFDNDNVNKFKSVKSNLFTYRKRTKEEELNKQLNSQSESIKNLDNTLRKFDEQNKQLEELSRTQKEKTRLNFNDKKKLETFLKRQEQQDELMKSFNKNLKDNLEEFQKDRNKKDVFKEDLKERLKENEEQLKKDEKILDELKKLQDKISKEDLAQKLDELAKQNKNKKRSLEQLLELTKRFYVEKKLDKLREDLENLSRDQEKLGIGTDEKNTNEKQVILNKEFEEFKKQLDNLKKDGNALKKPIEIPQDKLKEKEIQTDQKIASDELMNNEKSDNPNKSQNLKNAQNSQKRAAQRMNKLSQEMKSAMQAGGGEQMQEDVDMLRQVLDNVLLFSFEQEKLMKQIELVEETHNKFASYLKKQNSLREHFEHIDDSLFSMSLRQPKLSEEVNKEITEVFYNIDKALEYFADSQLFKGVSNQQFTITAANNLADFLSNILDNMQENLSISKGKGGKGDMQLPDIIMNQEELNKMMEEGMKNGESGKPKDSGGRNEKGKGTDGEKGNKGYKQNEAKDGNNDNGEGFKDDLNGLLYQIYQKQQELRNELQDKLAKNGLNGNGASLLRKMEEIEIDLLNKGFNKQTLDKMMDLKHQLLKLETASFEQGEDEKRESKTNLRDYNNNSNGQIPAAKQYFNTTEILNRQTLPLQHVYKKKVQEYFKQNND